MLIEKPASLREPKYLMWLRKQSCLITGQFANEGESVVPCHIGTAGRGLKSPDNEALPLLNSIHHEAHTRGEISVLREKLPDDVLRAALRAYARELHQGWVLAGRPE